jgi:SHS2 domain-containing protein
MSGSQPALSRAGMTYTFRFLDDIALADLAYEASGDSLQDVFQAATDAMVEAMANPLTIGTSWQQTIIREDSDPSSLLFEWLCDLVYWKDAAGVVFSGSEVRLVQGEDGLWKLTARVCGAPVKDAKQELRADVKGVTKHLYRLAHESGRWTARVVLDV